MKYEGLKQLLDRTITAAFMGNNSAFLGSLFCQLQGIIWQPDIATIRTDGTSIEWNPDFFLSLSPEARKTEFIHELWHIGRLHHIRCGLRDPKLWNMACDYAINNDLLQDGYSFVGLEGALLDARFHNTCEEEIYSILLDENTDSSDYQEDILPPNEDAYQGILNAVAAASQQARVQKQCGDWSKDVGELLNKFLSPILPWEQLLYKFMTALIEPRITWKKRNRRYPDIYLPGKDRKQESLEHLAYFLDTSGSISNAEILRFNSEIKHIKEALNPKTLTLIQFDTQIKSQLVFTQHDPFEEIIVIGRGGTSLAPVREWILAHKPTAAIIFSDMECTPMEPLSTPVPVIWAVSGGNGHAPAFGEVIRIEEPSL